MCAQLHAAGWARQPVRIPYSGDSALRGRAVTANAKLCRADRALSSLGYCTRNECSTFLRSHCVCADGLTIKKPSLKVKIEALRIDGEPVECPRGILVVLHKPVGYTCSHDPSEGPLIYDLLPQQWLRRRPAITSIGRLDKETSGLLLVTTLTEYVHKLTSPNHLIPKRYNVALEAAVSSEEQDMMVSTFKSGELMLHGESKACRPAQLMFTDEVNATVCISEGRYHQVRRMFAACGTKVIALHRAAVGTLDLATLAVPEGSWTHLPLDTSV